MCAFFDLLLFLGGASRSFLYPGVEELVMAIAIASDPIEYDSIDNKPVSIILLLVSPTDQTGPHIQALARISRLMLDDNFKQQLETASSPEDVYELISSRETQQ